MRYLLTGLALLALLPFLVKAAAPRPAFVAPPPRVVAPGHDLRFQLQGAGSCASMGCHNADPGPGFQGREMTLALERDGGQRVKDKHAQAYDVLFEERSKHMVRSLQALPAKADVHPQTEPLCLRCHVHPNYDRQPVRVVDGTRQFRLEDGVSCEACHGPAEHWLAAHFRPGWQALDPAARRAHGMADTRSVAGRARDCVECHVGRDQLDVNHDLLAAGHPRLNFEFGSQHQDLHKHWDFAKDKDTGRAARGRPDFAARAWAVGQAESARAALELLAGRAGDPARPWPELAEYDCFACHHELRGASWRRQPGSARARPGTLTWNRWYYAVLPDAVLALQGHEDAELASLLASLAQEMERPLPDRAAVRATAARAAARTADVLARWDATEAIPVEAALRRLLKTEGTRAVPTWDDARQLSLALEALAQARLDLGLVTPERDPLQPGLLALRKQLGFPAPYASPRGYQPAPVRQQLQELRLDR